LLARLLILFTVVPLVELALLLWIGSLTGWRLTLLLVLLTGIVGAGLARHQGIRCWLRVQQQLRAGQLPADPLVDGLMILVAGALLVTPGVLTDLFGFGLLLPPFRRILKRWLSRRFADRIVVSPPRHTWPPPDDRDRHDEIIDSRVIDVPPEEEEEDS